jgi:Class III cytochrome C family
MARRSIVVSFLMVFLILFVGVYGSGAQEATMVLRNKEVFQKLQRPPVTFSHDKHSQLYPDCIQCHHDYEYKDGKKENLWGGEGQPCSECHKLDKVDKKLPLRTAFHENCMNCHRQLEKEGKKSGPATCGECHVRSK